MARRLPKRPPRRIRKDEFPFRIALVSRECYPFRVLRMLGWYRNRYEAKDAYEDGRKRYKPGQTIAMYNIRDGKVNMCAFAVRAERS